MPNVTRDAVADTIVSQINSFDPMAFAAWGARSIHNVDKGLVFDTSGIVKWHGRVTISLNPDDTYTVRFTRMRKLQEVDTEVVDDVCVDNLVRVVDDKVI